MRLPTKVLGNTADMDLMRSVHVEFVSGPTLSQKSADFVLGLLSQPPCLLYDSMLCEYVWNPPLYKVIRQIGPESLPT